MERKMELKKIFHLINQEQIIVKILKLKIY